MELIAEAKASEVSGPVAITRGLEAGSSVILTASSLIISTPAFKRACVTNPEKASRSTARVPPAATLVSYAAVMTMEPSLAISSLRMPDAAARSTALSELLHTSSARPSIECAGEKRIGFISRIATRSPLFAA